MRLNEVPGEVVLLIHKIVFAELSVEAGFAESSDTLNSADGVFVEDIVVAKPEFEGEIAANGNEAMETVVVADGPGEAAKERDGESDARKFKRYSFA